MKLPTTKEICEWLNDAPENEPEKYLAKMAYAKGYHDGIIDQNDKIVSYLEVKPR